ncbi:hypothetical protein [Sandaracinobacteroides saxicola]|uniref:Uncharacterized protein n=1 Tax=Sandaracinobacteroides saxicola TaxID=2759707 RepID=A0A7G5IIL4_9SPHN|nr:hypothetical protein [Sandaracinobacteroides saxicola]QMW23206.1 hypothetical protein H3309_01470 [Sandaracinobacteroides saxicola]
MSAYRKPLRYGHLALTLALGIFVYSSSMRETAWFVDVIQLVAFPLSAFTGLGMWLAPRLFLHAGSQQAAVPARRAS